MYVPKKAAVVGISVAIAMSGPGVATSPAPRLEPSETRMMQQPAPKNMLLLLQKSRPVSFQAAAVSSSTADTSEETSLMAALAKLSAVPAGALGPGSKAVETSVLTDLMSLGSLSTGVHAVPMYDGSVALEWTRGDCEYTAEIRRNHVLFLCVDNVVTDELHEAESSFDAAILRNFIASGAMAS